MFKKKVIIPLVVVIVVIVIVAVSLRGNTENKGISVSLKSIFSTFKTNEKPDKPNYLCSSTTHTAAKNSEKSTPS